MAALHASDPGWRLVIVGGWADAAQLEARTEELGLAEVVDFRGYVPIDGELPRALYRSADAFCTSSWTEGVPQVLFEAFAAGLPVVATDVGGVARAVWRAPPCSSPHRRRRCGRRCSPRLAAEAPLRRRLVEEGLGRVREHTLEAETSRWSPSSSQDERRAHRRR